MSGGYIMRGDIFAYLSSQWIFIFCIKTEKLFCFKAQAVATLPLSSRRLIYTLIALLSITKSCINTANSAQLWALIAFSQNLTHSIFLYCSFFLLPTFWCISKHSVGFICFGLKENSSKLLQQLASAANKEPNISSAACSNFDWITLCWKIFNFKFPHCRGRGHKKTKKLLNKSSLNQPKNMPCPCKQRTKKRTWPEWNNQRSLCTHKVRALHSRRVNSQDAATQMSRISDSWARRSLCNLRSSFVPGWVALTYSGDTRRSCEQFPEHVQMEGEGHLHRHSRYLFHFVKTRHHQHLKHFWSRLFAAWYQSSWVHAELRAVL